MYISNGNVYHNRTNLKNKFILKSTNYFETNNASTKIVPRIDYKKGYCYHVSNQPKVSETIDILYPVYIL